MYVHIFLLKCFTRNSIKRNFKVLRVQYDKNDYSLFMLLRQLLYVSSIYLQDVKYLIS